MTRRMALMRWVLLAIQVLAAMPAAGGNLYYIAGSSIERTNLSGEGVETVVQGTNSSRHLAIDLVHDQIYWTVSLYVRRANLDGSDVETAHMSTPFNKRHVAVDPVGGRFYWEANGYRSAKLDGSDIQLLPAVDGSELGGVAIDSVNGKLYWTDRAVDMVMRSNLDGTASEALVGGTGAIAVDPVGGKIYWVNSSKIQRAQLDGTGVEDLVDDGPGSLAVDGTHQKLYWSDWVNRKISRSNLDGSDVEVLDAGRFGLVFGLALAVEGVCGNGVLDRFEECDDANVADGDGCQSECALPRCGDGVVDAGEACDDDNENSCDGCSQTCSLEPGFVCGDGIQNPLCGEECDDGNVEDADGCQGGCLLPVCGDTILDPEEACDDGNAISYDGCSASCATELGFVCGDGILNASCGEGCDDANTIFCDGCSATCAGEPGPVCGDGIVNTGCEECDHGGATSSGLCQAGCTLTPGSPVAMFHDQTDQPGASGTPDDHPGFYYPEYAAEAAVDFRVPGSGRWAITEVDTLGMSHSASVASVDITFYDDVGGLPGENALCSYPGLTSFADTGGSLSITLPVACTLDPGVYWLAQQVHMDSDEGFHDWSNRAIASGHEGAWRNPGGAFGEDLGLGPICLDWTSLTACEVLVGEPDLLFRIRGVELGGALVPVLGEGGLLILVIGLVGGAIRELKRRWGS